MRPPAATDFPAWVERLAVAHHHQEAMWHLIWSGPAALPDVRAGLAHDDPAVRVGCTKVLDHLVDDEALADLVEMVTDESAEVRIFALHALSCDRCKENGCSPSSADIVPAAADRVRNDPDAHVRAHAVGALGVHVHVSAEALDVIAAAAVDDPSPMVRKKARWYLPGGPRYEKTKPRTRVRA